NIVNDTVMGGRSSSRWSKNSSALSFEGFLSLENNGGFASVRHDLNNINLSSTEGIFIKVKGDGRKYQFRIRSQASRWANYSQEFKTKKDIVQSFFLPYKDFKPSWRGRSVRNVPTLTGKDVRGIGFLLGDKVQGKFKLDILNISASTQKDFKNLLSKSKTSSSSKRSKKDFDPMTINLVQ
ncbi:MAG: CIA30 family protein, partial [Limisphaerales bacterium]